MRPIRWLSPSASDGESYAHNVSTLMKRLVKEPELPKYLNELRSWRLNLSGKRSVGRHPTSGQRAYHLKLPTKDICPEMKSIVPRHDDDDDYKRACNQDDITNEMTLSIIVTAYEFS
ncbi:jg14928 [Pararge aegeria aegeria]|uniref:Jg14928 protein n=1 Tax=Pararge aegeria aegeria TaxID=348720 RepID=A0A8S4QQ92_9NEOP|nr:jg14928 [Pararge aegeria aegeria]